MKTTYDSIVAGAGLAGCVAALSLAKNERVLLIDTGLPGDGASGMAWGLADPLRPRKARTIWRADESLAALNRLLVEYAPGEIHSKGIVRPAQSQEQAHFFRQAASDREDLCRWIRAEEAAERWPWLGAEFGVLQVTAGHALSLGGWTQILAKACAKRGVEIRTHTTLRSWTSSPDHVEVFLGDDLAATCSRLLLCLGDGYRFFERLNRLNLHRVKGQVIHLEKPAQPAMIPPISGDGYLVQDGDTIFVGSTYEHTFDTLEPTQEAVVQLKNSASRLIPGLSGSHVLEHTSRVRITVPGIRLPMVGSLPDEERVWVFTALGSKGLFMSALLGQEIPGYFRDPSSIPAQCRVAERLRNH